MPTTTLSDEQLTFLSASRAATLATIAADGTPRPVPVCFVVFDGDPIQLYVPLDEKPKLVADVRDLARVRDILARPAVALLVDRWSEDWSELGWLRVGGTATILEPADDPAEHADAVASLRAKYPQYATHRLDERPLIRIAVDAARSWGNLAVSG